MRRHDLRRKICLRKRISENVFDNRTEAERDAREREQSEGRKFHAYRCPYCGKYHSGTWTGRKYRR